MGVSTFVLGTAFTVLPLVAAGLLAALVMLERRGERLAPAPPHAGRTHGRARARHRNPARAREGRFVRS
jgi:hypothetical protein